ncbi:hypothetical protein G3580_02720 [Nitrogeniibacter mangrovi]|uniref:Transmembrane protein n=1 Tax=Nitrogeniibacter mangrovi TaxID=2016596 RepID=A0A6C1AZ61_9RHOO|nr:BPSS1780 family membrane protein [Nitrogeniibacter mangrovi]QID16636.1 hypothetical protein G3580_02720 [Nitrogeniibacter mangrovi]
MQAYKRTPSHGIAWVAQGFALWKRNPALVTYLTFGYLLMLVVINTIPFIGQVIAALVMPAVSLGVLNGLLAVHEKRKVGPDVLFSGFKSDIHALVTVGGLYLIGSLLALAASAIADGGILLQILTGFRAPDEDTMNAPGLFTAALITVALTTPLMMAYWFAPMLVGWQKVSAPKAMFFSLVACWRNWPAFFLYSMGIFFVVIGAPSLLVAVIATASPTLASLLAIPLPLVAIPIVFATFLPNALDIFGHDIPGHEVAA